MTTTYSSIRGFIFGEGCLEGIGCITGDAGIDNSEALNEREFQEVVEAYLADGDYLANLDELKAEWAADKAALFAEYAATIAA